jgi:hypothetical protein
MEECKVENVEMQLSPDKATLIIKVDLTRRGEPSGSGKSIIIASTGGNIVVPGGNKTMIGLNVYTKNPDYEPPKG